MNEIEVPPLRERRKGLKQVIDDIINKYQERTREKMTIMPDASSVLLGYRWPGNTFEFKNWMGKVFINCNRLVLGLENIPLDIRQNNSNDDNDIPHLTSLAGLEMQVIEHACRTCR